MPFAGKEVKPGIPIIVRPKDLGGKLILTQATLGNGTSSERSILQCNFVADNIRGNVCTLVPEISESCRVNYAFDEEDYVIFSVVGPTSIHLSGFVTQEEPRDFILLGQRYEHDSHEEDIACTESEESDYDFDESFDYDLFGDDDVTMYPLSPVSNSGEVIDEIEDDKKDSGDTKIEDDDEEDRPVKPIVDAVYHRFEVQPGKPVKLDFEVLGGKFILVEATLDKNTSPKKSILQCNYAGDESPIFLCKLTPETVSESCSLDVEFEKEDDVKFSVVGPTIVHLTGYVVKDVDDKGYDESDAYGEDILGTELEESDFNSQESSDDDDDDVTMYPPSSVPNNGVSKKCGPNFENGDDTKIEDAKHKRNNTKSVSKDDTSVKRIIDVVDHSDEPKSDTLANKKKRKKKQKSKTKRGKKQKSKTKIDDDDTKMVVPELNKTSTKLPLGELVEQGRAELMFHALEKPKHVDRVNDMAPGPSLSQEDLRKIAKEVISEFFKNVDQQSKNRDNANHNLKQRTA